MDIQNISQLVIPILKEYGVKKASLFGSLIKGGIREDSDIDLLVEPPDKFGLIKFARMRLELRRALQKKVDLLTYNSISPYMKKDILKSAKILYEE